MSNHEVTLQDLKTVTAVLLGASPKVFTFVPDQISEVNLDGKESSKTIRGAGRGPRAHTTTVTDPMAKLKMSRREAIRFKRFIGDNGTCMLMVTTQPPDDVPVTDVVRAWKPTFGGLAIKSADAGEIEVSGNGLGDIEWDTKRAII